MLPDDFVTGTNSLVLLHCLFHMIEARPVPQDQALRQLLLPFVWAATTGVLMYFAVAKLGALNMDERHSAEP